MSATVRRWNSAPSGRIDGGMRDPSVRVAGRRVPEGLDEPQGRDHDPGVAEQLVGGGIRGSALGEQRGLIRVDRAVVAERIHEAARRPPTTAPGARSVQPPASRSISWRIVAVE